MPSRTPGGPSSAPPLASAAAWKASMEAHASQLRTRNYVDMQVARARVLGLAAGMDYAQALYPCNAIVLGSLAPLARPARRQ